MDEEITIIDSKTRNEKIKNFIFENKKKIITALIILILVPVGFYSLKIYKNSLRVKLSNSYNEAIIHFKTGNASQATDLMTKVVMKKDSTYSPLALYFLIDNSLIKEKREINKLFDILINKSSTDYEVKNLIIYKKALLIQTQLPKMNY